MDGWDVGAKRIGKKTDGWPEETGKGCGVRSCTLRQVLEYSPQSTLTDCARRCRAPGKAVRARASLRSATCGGEVFLLLRFVLVAAQQDVAPVGCRGGEQISVAAFLQFETLAQGGHGGGEVAHGQVGLPQVF